MCMQLRVARKESTQYSSYIKEETVSLKRKRKKSVNSKMQETGYFLKLLTGQNVLFVRRNQLKNLTVLLTGDSTTLVLDTLLLNKT